MKIRANHATTKQTQQTNKRSRQTNKQFRRSSKKNGNSVHIYLLMKGTVQFKNAVMLPEQKLNPQTNKQINATM